MNSAEYDIIIIGAGPAGLSAATLAAKYKANVLILDENHAPGGQIYRGIEANQSKALNLGESYQQGLTLVKSFRDSNVDYRHSAKVWYLSSDAEVRYSIEGESYAAKGRQILIATGAQERPFPLHGWTLNGVMSAGSAQTLLKESSVVCEGAVFVGSGPLMYLIAHQYISADIPIKAIIDTTPRVNYLHAMIHGFRALKGIKNIIQGWRWKREIIRSNVLYVSNICDVRINGFDSVKSVDYLKNGTWKSLKCEHVFLHQGVIPDVNISLSVGCEKKWDEQQACWTINVDEYGQSSVDGISVAGDAGTVTGGVAAAYKGSIAMLNMLCQIDFISSTDRDRLSKPLKKALKAETSPRAFINALFMPHQRYRIPENDNTIICRCEEVTVAHIKESIRLGCIGANQIKSFTRCGMGPCQGRFCGLSVTEIMAKELGVETNKVDYFNIRSPIKPVTLGELASVDEV
ncbi:MAG: FAD-dependent oxidoreductase [Gammaproteobacteria bacterium]|nr:FAD-dependent oxidoreductase [Gammaproteobacteria bacterium]